jgi:flagellar hook-associated protein 2
VCQSKRATRRDAQVCCRDAEIFDGTEVASLIAAQKDFLMAAPIGINSIVPALGSGSQSGASGLVSSPNSGLLSSPGIGSGLNVKQIVSELVATDKAPAQDQINRQLADVKAQTSAFGKLKSLLSSLQSSLGSLADGSAFTQRTATSSDDGVFTASASASAIPGTYQIEVDHTAAAQQAASGAFAGNADVGTGTLTVSIGGHSADIAIDSDHDTLADIRAAINGAADNPGVTATIVHATDGDHLVLASTKTGTANAFSISASGGDGGLAALTWDAGAGSGNLTLQNAAADTKVEIDGFPVTSSSDIVDDAITGVTLNIAAAKPGQAETLTVGRDEKSMQNRVQNFVAAYNGFVKGAGQLASYDSTTKVAGPLLGNAALLTIRSRLASVLSGVGASNGGALNTLDSVGISLQRDGSLKLDTTKLDDAFKTNPKQFANLFSSAQGYATRLENSLKDYLGDGGLLDVRNKNLSAQGQRLQQKQTALDRRMQAVQERYLKQFTALDVTMAQMNQTSTFLQSQLKNLMAVYQPNSGSK